MLNPLKGCNYFSIGFIYFLKMTIVLHFDLHYREETGNTFLSDARL